MDSLDADEAEVFAPLVGCCELPRLGGCNAIIEGDSVSKIKRGSKPF